MNNEIEIVNYNDWTHYDGFAEGSGRSEKIWLQSPEGRIGLFKYPKVDPDTKDITYEHVSEHLAYLIAQKIGVETATVDIGIYDNRYGCMSYLLNNEDEAIIEGANFIIGKHPEYDLNLMRDVATGKYYCMDYLFEITDNSAMRYKWIQMMLFDFLIGNSDRHQNNWAIILKYADRSKSQLLGKACPLYDNGSSLCCYVNDKLLKELLGHDRNRLKAQVDTKSRSMIRIDGYVKQRPTHREVVSFLLNSYEETKHIADKFIELLSQKDIQHMLQMYPEILLNADRKELIERFLCEKLEILKTLRKEVL